MSETKPVPMYAVPKRALCPVCGKASYSPSGTHPQCAVARADAISRAARKAAAMDEDVKKSPDRKSWCKLCPKCKQQVPSRRFVCDCGHQFVALPVGTTKKALPADGEAIARKPR